MQAIKSLTVLAVTTAFSLPAGAASACRADFKPHKP